MRKNSEFHSTKTLVIDLSNSFVNSKQVATTSLGNQQLEAEAEANISLQCNVESELDTSTQSEESERW